MKKLNLILITLFLGLFLWGCHIKQDREVTAEERYKARVTRESKNVMITEIDSCEYLTFYTYGGALVFTHKGNCKYCRAWIKRTCN